MTSVQKMIAEAHTAPAQISSDNLFKPNIREGWAKEVYSSNVSSEKRALFFFVGFCVLAIPAVIVNALGVPILLAAILSSLPVGFLIAYWFMWISKEKSHEVLNKIFKDEATCIANWLKGSYSITVDKEAAISLARKFLYHDKAEPWDCEFSTVEGKQYAMLTTKDNWFYPEERAELSATEGTKNRKAALTWDDLPERKEF